MGGGSAMKASAKVAGIIASIRSVPGIPTSENAFASAVRKATPLVSAIFSSTDTNPASAVGAVLPKPSLEGWELAGGEKKVMGEPLPRLVFGGPPTPQEAKEATYELKEALDKPYLSTNSTTGSYIVAHAEQLLSIVSKSGDSETKACVTNEVVPKHAIQAFRFLNESSVAQTVVTSIANDSNVWEAVMQNEALVGFIQSQKTGNSFTDMIASAKESAADSKYQSCESANGNNIEMCNLSEHMPRNGFAKFFHNLKVNVVETMNKLSDYFQNVVGTTEEVDGSKTTFNERATGTSFIGLAIMVILLVILKRG